MPRSRFHLSRLGLALFGLGFAAIGVSVCRLSAHMKNVCELVRREGSVDAAVIHPVVADIELMESAPERRALLAAGATMRFVQYQDATQIYGSDRVPSLAVMLQARESRHSPFLIGDCKTRAVFAGAVLTGLGIPWRPVASPVLHHVWIRVYLDGTAFDMLKIDQQGRWQDALLALSGWLGFDTPLAESPPYEAPPVARTDEARQDAIARLFGVSRTPLNPAAPKLALFPYNAPL